jgi:integrase
VRTLSEYLGHSNASITLKTYSHLMPDAEARGLRAVDAFFAGASAPVVRSEVAE